MGILQLDVDAEAVADAMADDGAFAVDVWTTFAERLHAGVMLDDFVDAMTGHPDRARAHAIVAQLAAAARMAAAAFEYTPADLGDCPVTSETFGFDVAITRLKQGAKLQRTGWNGKGMWVFLTVGRTIEAGAAMCGEAAAQRALELDDEQAEIEILPRIDMRAADGAIVVGWLASQTDLLADDWRQVHV